MIKNIVFDMGGVIIRFDREFYIGRLDVSPEDGLLLMNEVFRSVEWCMMDRGSLDEAAALARMKLRLPEHLHEAARKLVFEWDLPTSPIPGMEELVRDLKENGYRVFLLSNASVRQPEYWARVPAARYFDGTLISSSHGLLKPQPEIYHLAFETFGIDPAESVFVDDTPPNAEGSLFCGMDAFVFNGDAEAFRSWLRKKGVRV